MKSFIVSIVYNIRFFVQLGEKVKTVVYIDYVCLPVCVTVLYKVQQFIFVVHQQNHKHKAAYFYTIAHSS